MALVLNSNDFVPEDILPVRFTCEGQDISPALTWGGTPPNTQSFVLICEDPDAPRGLWVHWVMYNIPPDTRGLAAGVAKDEELPDGSRQGRNDFGKIGYNGPCPPPGHGPHRYYFRLYALDNKLTLPPGASRADVLAAIEGHILAQAELMGRFERKTRR